MTNNQIEAFLVLCKYLNISAASEALFITQPALSRTIRALETELGYPLFLRRQGSRRIALSAEGEAFYTIASEMKQLYQQAKTIHEEMNHRSFSLTAPPSLFRTFLPQACIRFKEAYPEVRFSVDMLHSSTSFQQVRKNIVDMAVVNENYIDPSVRSIPLFREDIALICSRGMFPEGAVNPADLNREKAVIVKWNPEYRYWFEHWFGKDFEVPQMHLLSGNTELFRYFTDFWAILPASLVKQIAEDVGLDMHPLTGSCPSRFCYCVHRMDEEKQDLHQAMLQILRDCIPHSSTIHPL